MRDELGLDSDRQDRTPGPGTRPGSGRDSEIQAPWPAAAAVAEESANTWMVSPVMMNLPVDLKFLRLQVMLPSRLGDWLLAPRGGSFAQTIRTLCHPL